jgi:hypothetical protein
MYVKISNVSTKTQLIAALPAANRGLLSAAQKSVFAVALISGSFYFSCRFV